MIILNNNLTRECAAYGLPEGHRLTLAMSNDDEYAGLKAVVHLQSCEPAEIVRKALVQLNVW
jgi:hypothetical protein